MAFGRRAAVAIGLAALLGGCTPHRLGVTWEIALITPRVPQGGDLVFRVETRDAVGTLVEGVDYQWAVDWKSVKGSTHRSSSCTVQHVRVEGPKGPAKLLVFTANEDGTLVEMAKAEFLIE
jgi:hypothetical protein